MAVTNESLAESYVRKCETRLRALRLMLDEGDHSDVVREAQELVELALKAMLRAVGVEPPKLHEVGELLVAHAGRFPEDVRSSVPRAAEISKTLRKDRELAFYGAVDFIPTLEYTETHSTAAYEGAAWVLSLARDVVGRLGR